jgi:hypothetical protein
MLDRDLTVPVDPAITRPISITPPVAATMHLADVGFLLQSDGSPVAAGANITEDLSTLSTAQLGDPLPGTTVNGWVSSHWSGTDGAAYDLAWSLDEYPTGFTRTVDRSELAKVEAEFGPGIEGGTAERSKTPLPAPGVVAALEFGYEVELPGARTEYVTTEGVTWRNTLWQFTEEGQVAILYDSPWLSYRAGRTYQAPINYPVFGPGLPPTTFPWAYRFDDAIDVYIPLYTDRYGNANTGGLTGTGSTRLYLGDQLVGESPVGGRGFFPDLPAATGDYRLTTEETRPALFDLTTSVSAEWTFSSSHVDGGEPVALDLNVVRFAPKLAADGSAPAGRPFIVPVQVQNETGATQRPRRLTVEVSYDEGGSWQRVPVIAKLAAVLYHPAGATSVSLRASATDRDGNTVEQTVIRAYRLR